MKSFDVKDVYQKYFKNVSENKYEWDLIGRTFEIIPANNEEIASFRKNCESHNVPAKIENELTAYYRQNNNFFNYFSCDDLSIFEWWDERKELWLGCVDMDVFRYCSGIGKYTIGDVGDVSYGDKYEFDSIEDMLNAIFYEYSTN